MKRQFNLQEARNGKPVRTRDGREARILTFDAHNEKYPIIALVMSDTCDEFPHSYTVEGRAWVSGCDDGMDLVMAGERRRGWIGIFGPPYPDMMAGTTGIYRTKEELISLIQDKHWENEEIIIQEIEWKW